MCYKYKWQGVMQVSEEFDRKLWHEAFYGSIKLELRKYRDVLEYSEEQTLGKEPEANERLYEKIRSETSMTGHGLRNLFKEETEQLEREAERRGMERGRQEGMEKGMEKGRKVHAEMIAYMRKIGLTEEQIRQAPDFQGNDQA